MKKDERYYTFPVTILQGAFDDVSKVCDNILDYCHYRIASESDEANTSDKMKRAEKFFGVTIGNPTLQYKNGYKIYRDVPPKTPVTSIKKDLVFDYYKNHKDEFEIAVFLAFCSIRSILQTKPYTKITNDFLFSRMNGNINSEKNYELLNAIVKKYTSIYYRKKIINELIDNWSLKYYATNTRGFYVSFSTELEDLVYQVRKKQKSYRDKVRKEKLEDVIRKADERLNKTSS